MPQKFYPTNTILTDRKEKQKGKRVPVGNSYQIKNPHPGGKWERGSRRVKMHGAPSMGCKIKIEETSKIEHRTSV
jgi:hypothetical protein